MNQHPKKHDELLFDTIMRKDDNGNEFWYARDLQHALEYTQWRNFEKVIDKAKEACMNANNLLVDHFADVSKMVLLGSGAQRLVDDIALSRYACYLIVMNGDPRKEVIALGQTYFAIKTRERELSEQFDNLNENQKRLAIRSELKTHNKSLFEAAQLSGVKTPKDFAIFQNKGYQGLYGGLTQKDIHTRKGLTKNEKILDHMGSTELAANLFRATQTDEKLRRDAITDKERANTTHYNVGKKVRETIRELGGTMPENLPTPNKSIKQLEKEKRKEISDDSST